ncbi:exodeoxyribonuclease III [Candidatus Peregrinibacteria bacterium CG_4_10_14_0_2_um_filter_43_11]|nr:MAG: exodeoxyribonuclease III [Candidatus Peregrinibacteria bacterium CG_4_10_14_0_2_um_filter_43_11]
MSKSFTLFSWNVNGIRAVLRKGFLEWLDHVQPDVLCLQETKACPEQLGPDVLNHDHYYSYWHSSTVKKGYSGVVTFSKEKPICVETGFGIEKFDREGRVVMTEFREFILFNVYFPNGKKNGERLNYKLEFYEVFLKTIDDLKKKGKKIVFCGDVNTAHTAIDLAHPKQNEGVSGFLPIERAWIDRIIAHDYVDSLREFHPEPELYSWWDFKTRARDRNVGWRIDYFFVQKELKKHLKGAFILPEVMGSDHCPVGIQLEF